MRTLSFIRDRRRKQVSIYFPFWIQLAPIDKLIHYIRIIMNGLYNRFVFFFFFIRLKSKFAKHKQVHTNVDIDRQTEKYGIKENDS